MFYWSKFPFVRVAIFLVLGILFGVYFPQYDLVFVCILIFTLAILSVLLYRTKDWLIKYNVFYGISLSFMFFALGYLFINEANDLNSRNHIVHQRNITYYTAKVISEPKIKNDFLQVQLEVFATKAKIWQRASGKVLAYIKLPLDVKLTYGDKLLVKGLPKHVSPPHNPHEFNYQQYLAFNNIHHQQFIGSNQWQLLAKAAGFNFISSSFYIRDYLETILGQHINGQAELAIAKALILGDKKDLDRPTRDIYAMAGAMHVLAVSGLHVGIIYMVLLFVLGQGKNKVKNPRLVAWIIIPVLWAYAFITGLSPSVLRAVTMFSFLAMAQAFNRKSNTFNTLAISAILLLLINPFMIMSVGFQLSYIAVIGIIFWYPVFEKIINPTNSIMQFVWQITALSMAAQLATSPLSALYFHRFPTYFFVSNLLVIPAATIIVWGGLILISFGAVFASVGSVIGTILQNIIYGVNVSLKWIASLPFADIHNLAPSILDTWVLYGIIILSFLYFSSRKLYYFRLMAMVIMVFFISLIYAEYNSKALRQIVFYSVSNSWAIDLIEHKQYVTVADSALLADDDKIDFLITPNRRYYGLKLSRGEPIKTKRVPGLGEVFVWHTRVILLADACTQAVDIPKYFDFVLFKAGQSNPNCYQEQIVLRKFVNNQGQQYAKYNLRSGGALVVDI